MKKTKRVCSLLLALLMLAALLPQLPGEAATADRAGEAENPGFVRNAVTPEAADALRAAEAEAAGKACACADCTCVDCACEDGACLCDGCGDACACSDGSCTDCLGGAACACETPQPSARAMERRAAVADELTRRAVSAADCITDAAGRSLAARIAERDERKAAHYEALAEQKAAVHPLIAAKLAAGETGGRLTEAELMGWEDYDWAEDAVECEYCGEYIWGDWVCENGDHCSENAGNEDCYSSEHCSECGSCTYTVCEDCYRCEVCWYHCIMCDECCEPNEVCETCRCCESCQEEKAHCRDCGDCFMDDTGSYTLIWNECVENEHWHCSTCAADYMCVDCLHCFYGDLDYFCPICCLCIDCGVTEGTHCYACQSMDACGDDGALCEDCGLCEDCQYNFMDDVLDGINTMHCWECDTCAKTGGDGFWCRSFFEEGGGNPHCTDCCELCPQCEKCAVGFGFDFCSDCGLCPECCEENTLEDGCEHGYCLESAEFQEHLCPSCFDCVGGERCQYCGMCEQCCEGYHCAAHDWCPDAPGYEEHFCDGCGECVDPDEMCEDCGLCLVCQEDYHCEHDICPDGSDAMDHFCDECGECMEELCEVCGGHAVHCEEGREDYGCDHDWTCPNSSDWEDHFCDDCGYCFDPDEMCEDCGLCFDCCHERSEDFGCDHEVCVESSDWEEHYCFEDGQCLEICLEEGTHEENCDHDPDGDYCFDEDRHWQHCTECEGRVEIEDHDIVAVTLREPSYTEEGLERYSCAVCEADLGTGRIPRRVLGDHEHVFGGNARCTVCGYLNTALPRIVSEPLDARRTVSVAGTDYSDNRATFTVYAKGEDLRYQWYVSVDGEEETLKDGTMVSGAKTAKLSVVVPTDACAHEYVYTCRVSNGQGTVTSRAAHLRGQHLYYWVHGGTPTSVTVNGTKYFTYPQHYQRCAGEDCGLIRRAMDHNWPAAWELEYAALSSREGLRSRACLTCGEKEYRIIPRVEANHVHSYAVMGSSEVGHWKECACGKRTDRGDHVFDDSGWTVDVPATETEKGRELNHCTVCGWEKSREIPVIPHVHNLYTWEEITDGYAAGTWESMIAADDHYHYRKCHYYDSCGYMLPEAHDYVGWHFFNYNDDGTATVVRTCMTCGWEQSFRVDPLDWQLIGKGARIAKDSDPTVEVSSTYGPLDLRVYPLQKVGYLFDHFEVVYGSEYLTQIWSSPESDGGYLFHLTTPPRSFREGTASYIDHQIVVEAVYTPCSHPIRHRSQQGGFPAGCVTYGKTPDTVCDDCGAIVSEGAPIEPIGHHDYKLNRSTALPGYCTYVPANPRTGGPGRGQVGRGYEGDWVCSVCGDVKKGKKTPPTHNRTEVRNKVEPTCTEPGYSGDTWCLSCGAHVSRGRTVKSTGHSWVWGDYIQEPTNKTTGRCWAVCETCGEQRVCTANDSPATIARLGFTEEEWQAKLGYTGEDWEVKLTVTTNQKAKGSYDLYPASYTVDMGVLSWKDEYFSTDKLPTYTFTFESTGRSRVNRVINWHGTETDGAAPFAWEAGEDGMSLTVTAPFGEYGVGSYAYRFTPFFEVQRDDGTVATVSLGAGLVTVKGRETTPTGIRLTAEMQSGSRERKITLTDGGSAAGAPLDGSLYNIRNQANQEITGARAGEKVTLFFNTQDGEGGDWARFQGWEFVSARPSAFPTVLPDALSTFIMPDGDVALKAKYEGSGKTYEIRFELGGVGAPLAPVTRAGASLLGSLPTPVDASGKWSFAGWYRDDGFRTPVDPSTELVRGSLTLYARWVKRSGSLPGDVNADGTVDREDAMRLFLAASGHAPTGTAMDLDRDGRVNTRDALLLFRMLAGE